MAGSLKNTYNNMISRIREILDEGEVPTVEGLADSIASLEAESPEFVIVPPAVLVSIDNVRTNLDNMSFVVNTHYEVTFVILILVETLPDKITAFGDGLEIGQDILDGLINSLPDNIYQMENPEFNFAFAGEGFVGIEMRFDAKIK